MNKHFRIFCALICCVATVSQAFAQVLEGPRGPVEFIGLKDWTATDLFEAIQETSPDKPFHACAAVLKTDLGFADAAALGYMESFEDVAEGGEFYTVIVGVEDSSGVQYGKIGNKTLDLPGAWDELHAMVEDDFNTLVTLTYAHLLDDPDDIAQLAEFFGADGERVSEASTVVAGLNQESDQDFAFEVLKQDESWSARAVALFVLAQFPDSNASWLGLASGLIDPVPQVRDLATKLLDGLTQVVETVRVDWSGARGTILALLGGTYPFAFLDILETLVATEVDPELGRELVQKRPDLLLAYAGAEHEKSRATALSFLNAISVEDFGRDIEAWREWIEDL